MTWATAQELRSQINKTSTLSDADLELLLTAAENTINRFCNRTDTGFLADSTATAKRYTGSGKPYLFIDECTEITLVEVKESVTDSTYTSWASGDWIPFRGDPKDPDFNNTPYTALMVDPTGDYSIFHSGKFGGRAGFRPEYENSLRGAPTVRVTAKWGAYATIPTELKEASIMQAARWFKRLESGMSDALASGELGTLLYRQSLDPDIKQILVGGRFVRPTVGRR